MKIEVYFAVNMYGSYMYLTEHKMHNFEKASRLIDLICDHNALEDELNWNKIDKAYKPTDIGVYQAVVKYIEVSEDDYRLDVLSCTPIAIV